MSPNLIGPIQWLTGGVDDARQDAEHRLGVILDQLAAEGKEASGSRGDELAPTALDDALRQFPADYVIVGLRSSQKEPRQRHRAIEHLLDRHATIPLTIFTVDA